LQCRSTWCLKKLRNFSGVPSSKTGPNKQGSFFSFSDMSSQNSEIDGKPISCGGVDMESSDGDKEPLYFPPPNSVIKFSQSMLVLVR